MLENSHPRIHRAGGWDEGITPAIAGWAFVSTRVHALTADAAESYSFPGSEVAIVPLSGRLHVTSDGEAWELGGRASVFDGLGWCLYLPKDARFTVTALGDAEYVVSSAPATRTFPPRLVSPDDVAIDVRGAGNASRQIGNLILPEFPADRIHVIEVWTPGGNWSSYPPHKHEVDRPGETELEETYYYRFRDPADGWAIQRVYSPERDVDLVETVRDGDICTIPWGYHTTVAAHGFDLYYLNILAGPGPARSLEAHFDEHLTGVRDDWPQLQPDARLPLIPRYPND